MARVRRTAEQQAVAEEAARIVLDAGGTLEEAAQAAEVNKSTVSRWVDRWESTTEWRRHVRPDAVAAQTAPARAAAIRRWTEHRDAVGFNAGMLAGAAIRRAAELLPLVGEYMTVVDVETDGDGNQVGKPTTKALPNQAALDIERLARSAERFWLMADKSAGLASGDVAGVDSSTQVRPSLEESRARLLKLVRDGSEAATG